MKKYTLCFIQKGNEILLLNRNFAPNKGLWNGVGGKIEQGEEPKQSALREIREETGIILLDNELNDKGTVDWIVEGQYAGGLYIYHAIIPETTEYITPLKTEEGILDWKRLDWIIDEQNLGIAELVPKMLQKMIYNDNKYKYISYYENDKLVKFEYESILQ